MQQSPQQIKSRLIEALDEDNNVVNMAQVMEVISTLEKYPISRQALEQTRIGKHINELRKKTDNSDLAKRAKCLVRAWQKLLVTPANDKPVNGTQSQDGRNIPKLSPPINSRTSSPRCPVLSPAVSPRKPIDAAKSSLSLSSVSHPVSPSVRHLQTSVSYPNSPSTLHLPVNTTTSRSQSPKTNNNTLHCDKNRVNHVKSDSAIHPCDTSRSDANSVDSPACTRRKRTHSTGGDDLAPTPTKIAALIPAKSSKKRYAKYKELQAGKVNGIVPHAKSYTPKESKCDDLILNRSNSLSDGDKNKTPKVKTTAQIIESLQKSANMKSSVGKSIDFIEREVDDVNISVVPNEVLPKKSRKKDNLQLPASKPKHKMSRTKEELVKKYLDTLQPASISPVKHDPSPISSPNLPSESQSVESLKLENRSISPAFDPSSICDPTDVTDDSHPSATLLELFAQLPPLNVDEINYDDGYSDPIAPSLGTDTDVDRLDTQSWPFVNGIYDFDNDFCDWTRTLTLRSYDDEPLHILPYVITDRREHTANDADEL